VNAPSPASGAAPSVVSRVLRMYGRALLLRCPSCGGGPVRRSWLAMHPRCAGCGLRTERGEEDFFLGAMMFNLVFAEGLMAATLVLVAVLSWPDVPWNALWFGGIALMVAAPFFFYPFSQTVWLASDLLLRPASEEEMEWHRSADPSTFRPLHDR
jgi:uncharacterized protein (DUF983 family)